ncbi:hypothetical protein J1N35_045119 [Gossypium stocksii]|uniref:Uncharacterized protein n=1 Tax=Gossypium stocksii TaxID=47602 RepID=A0A9D3ZGR7_9ROSI|nr:hypothetical protein J1N35_045119 [Gossypium stocksii]
MAETLSLVEFVIMKNSTGSNSGVVNEEEEYFESQDGDVATELVNGGPSITFSDRVHQFIEYKMALIVIVKLLGKKVGFNELLNKLSTLWNLGSIFQLMD